MIPSYKIHDIKIINEPCITPYYRYTYKTCNDLDVFIDNDKITVPSGFHTDLASIPRFMWAILSPRYSAFIAPAIIHDYLYSIKTKKGRKYADDVLLSALLENNVSYYTSMKFYYGVRLFGWLHFKKKDNHYLYANSVPDSKDSRFNYAVKIILEHEGYLSDNKKDPGLTTKWGISLRFLKLAGIDIDNDGDVDVNDVLALKKYKAIDIYKKYWWDKHHYNNIKDLEVATKVFDLAVNMGPIASHKILQEAINNFTKPQIKVDGIIGKQTIKGANKIRPDWLMDKIREGAKKKYLAIINDNPHLDWAKEGWLNRASW